MKQKTILITQRTAMPILCSALCFSLGCIILPMLEIWHYVVCLLLVSGGFVVGLKLFPATTQEVALPLSEFELQLQQQLEAGWQCVAQLQEAVKQVKLETTKKDLEELSCLTKQIMQDFENKPELQNQLRRMIEHYLPMLAKLVESYIEMENVSLSNENIQESQAEIEQTIQLCTQAFRQQYNDLHEKQAMEVNADTDVLEALLVQQGLLKTQTKEESL